MITILTYKDLVNTGKSILNCSADDFKIDLKTFTWADAIIYIDSKAFKIIKSKDLPIGSINDIAKLQEFIEITCSRNLGKSTTKIK